MGMFLKKKRISQNFRPKFQSKSIDFKVTFLKRFIVRCGENIDQTIDPGVSKTVCRKTKI